MTMILINIVYEHLRGRLCYSHVNFQATKQNLLCMHQSHQEELEIFQNPYTMQSTFLPTLPEPLQNVYSSQGAGTRTDKQLKQSGRQVNFDPLQAQVQGSAQTEGRSWWKIRPLLSSAQYVNSPLPSIYRHVCLFKCLFQLYLMPSYHFIKSPVPADGNSRDSGWELCPSPAVT